MKKQTARTIATLSLFVTLLVSASHVSAFPVCHGYCKPAVQSAAAAPAPTVNSVAAQVAGRAPAQDTVLTDVPTMNSTGSIALFWTRMVTLFVSLF